MKGKRYTDEQIIGNWQQHYNHERPHSSLGYQAPSVFESEVA